MVNILQAATEGIGVYTIAEAARYARMPAATLHAWFFGLGERPPMQRGGIQTEEFRAITFVDFVEALAIRSLRADRKISLQKIRAAIRNARDRYKVEHLFARSDHRTVLIGSDLHIFLKDDPKNPVGLTGRDLGQKSITVCLESYMEDLEYDAAGMARIYTALAYKNQKVILDPRIHFGEPVIAENGFTAQTLWQAAVAEGSIEKAAEIYEVSVAAVETAYRYFNRELGVAA